MKTEQKVEIVNKLKIVNALKEANSWMFYLLGKSDDEMIAKVEERVIAELDRNKQLIDNAINIWEQQGFRVGITQHRYVLEYNGSFGSRTNLQEELLWEEVA